MGNFRKYLKYMAGGFVADRPQLMDLADRLQAFWNNGRTGDVLNVSMPTRFGKSMLATSFSSWLLIGDPSLRILRASYAEKLAEKFSVQVRDQYLRFYENVGCTLPVVSGTRAQWSIGGRTEPSHTGVGLGGGITGFGFDVAIVDDTAKGMLDATSAAYGRQLQVFKESVLLGRLEGPRKVLNVGTRWTVNDWFSLWPDAESYVLPAMVDGRSVCEAWKTTAELELERSRVSESVWNAQYMQHPTETGRIRLFEGWQPEVVEDVPSGSRVVVIDPATDYGKDFFVIGEYVYSGGMVYLCDMYAEQASSPEAAAAWLRGRDYKVAWIECNGVGSSVMAKMRAAGCRSMAGFSTVSDKYSRAYVQAEAMKNYFRISAGCNPAAIKELKMEADTFPIETDGVHDDLLDNVVMAFERTYKI